MAFTEREENFIEIIPPYNIIQCKRVTIVEKDGVEIARSNHRHVRVPGEDVSSDCSELQAVANTLWTDEVIAAYEAQRVNEQIPLDPES